MTTTEYKVKFREPVVSFYMSFAILKLDEPPRLNLETNTYC